MRGHAGNVDAVDDVVAPAERMSAPGVAAASATAELAAPASAARLESDVAFNPFGALSAGAPAALGQPKEAPPPSRKPVKQAVAAPPAPPPAPVAPPLPFVAIGSIVGADVTGGQPVAFLQQQDQLLVVHAGESLGNTYRVESITAQSVELTYLPLKQRQSLPLAP
jgi:Tfp pilus assembly protein PilP